MNGRCEVCGYPEVVPGLVRGCGKWFSSSPAPATDPVVVPRFLLGDAVAWALSLIGIKPWEGCGCKSRQAWLNRWSLAITMNAERAINRAARFMLPQ